MGIYIKDIEMPTSCLSCDFCNPFADTPYCRRLMKTTPISTRLAYCPLVPVPPHGRLIDADALAVVIAEGLCPSEKNKGFEHPFDIFRSISNAPTIIEAEESEGEYGRGSDNFPFD